MSDNMYNMQNWNNYDYEKSIQANMQRNAIVTEDNMNHIEKGLYRANRPIVAQVKKGGENFAIEVKETNEATILDILFPNQKTDLLLETKGIAADAKATGDYIDALRYAIEVLTQRMDNANQLPAGSTTGDAELADIRVGIDGNTYNTAGEAVRIQLKEIRNSVDDVQEVLDKGQGVVSIAEGLEYEPLEL